MAYCFSFVVRFMLPWWKVFYFSNKFLSELNYRILLTLGIFGKINKPYPRGGYMRVSMGGLASSFYNLNGSKFEQFCSIRELK